MFSSSCDAIEQPIISQLRCNPLSVQSKGSSTTTMATVSSQLKCWGLTPASDVPSLARIFSFALSFLSCCVCCRKLFCSSVLCSSAPYPISFPYFALSASLIQFNIETAACKYWLEGQEVCGGNVTHPSPSLVTIKPQQDGELC